MLIITFVSAKSILICYFFTYLDKSAADGYNSSISRGEFHMSDPRGTVAAILFLAEELKMANEVMEITEQMLTGIYHQIKEMVGMNHEE